MVMIRVMVIIVVVAIVVVVRMAAVTMVVVTFHYLRSQYRRVHTGTTAIHGPGTEVGADDQ